MLAVLSLAGRQEISLSKKQQPPVNYLLIAGEKPHLGEPERGVLGRVK